MAAITAIEGIGPSYAEKLAQAGITTVEGLLKKGGGRKARETLVAETGISAKLILKWVNRADLFRINGVAEQYSDLLEAAGVDTVVELAQRVPANLHAKLEEVRQSKGLVRTIPAESVVAGWIEQAKTLPRKVTY